MITLLSLEGLLRAGAQQPQGLPLVTLVPSQSLKQRNARNPQDRLGSLQAGGTVWSLLPAGAMPAPLT